MEYLPLVVIYPQLSQVHLYLKMSSSFRASQRIFTYSAIYSIHYLLFYYILYYILLINFNKCKSFFPVTICPFNIHICNQHVGNVQQTFTPKILSAFYYLFILLLVFFKSEGRMQTFYFSDQPYPCSVKQYEICYKRSKISEIYIYILYIYIYGNHIKLNLIHMQS